MKKAKQHLSDSQVAEAPESTLRSTMQDRMLIISFFVLPDTDFGFL